MLLNLLLELGRDDQARTLLKEYQGDWSADMAYASALLAFKKTGDSQEARLALANAMTVNQHVPVYLTGEKRIPPQRSNTITLGGVDEAVYYASANLNHWRKTPGAVDWLKANHQKRK